jgi:hypothetical protein
VVEQLLDPSAPVVPAIGGRSRSGRVPSLASSVQSIIFIIGERIRR